MELQPNYIDAIMASIMDASVNLSIKNVPESLVERLRERAKRNHRSMQGELMMILEESLESSAIMETRAVYRTGLDASDVHRMVRSLNLRTGSDSTRLIREDRDAR